MSFRRCRLIAGIGSPSGPRTRPRIEPDPAAEARGADGARTARITSKAASGLEFDLTFGDSSSTQREAWTWQGRAAYDRPTCRSWGVLGLRRAPGRLVAARSLKECEGGGRRHGAHALEGQTRSDAGANDPDRSDCPLTRDAMRLD